jgi:AcrR family transcriptional regulator
VNPTDEATPPPRRYHHGALPDALLAAAEAVLRRDGIGGLGLRAIAREAGVSHAAPKHHFGDTTGLLSALAAAGYTRLADAMRQAAPEGGDVGSRRNAIARAYVHFADANPALFGLMFRNEKIDMQQPVLRAAASEAMRVMAAIIGGAPRLPDAPPTALSDTEAMQITAAWAYVHGLATLLIDQRLRGIVRLAPGFDAPLALVDAVLEDGGVGLRFSAPA